MHTLYTKNMTTQLYGQLLPPKWVKKAGLWVVTEFEGKKQINHWFHTKSDANVMKMEMK